MIKAAFLVLLQIVGGNGAVAVKSFVIRTHRNRGNYHRITHQFF